MLTHRDKAASETHEPPPTAIDPLPFRFFAIHRVPILFFFLLLVRNELVGRNEFDESGAQKLSGTALIIPYLDRLCRRLFLPFTVRSTRNPRCISTPARHFSSPRSSTGDESPVARAHTHVRSVDRARPSSSHGKILVALSFSLARFVQKKNFAT